jgi:cytochrome c
MKYAFICLAACMLFAAPALADGPADLYAKNCKGCHGGDGAKVAMGMTRPLNALTLDEVKAALAGYRAGTYGGEKKAMMERVVKPLSDADLEALASHVDSL